MATLVLGAVGSAIGGAFGGTILDFSGAANGGFIGSTIGSAVDNWIVSSLAPAQRIEGARLDSLRITSSTEGAVIPRLYGRMRLGGNIIWATDFREETRTNSQGGGKGGGVFKDNDLPTAKLYGFFSMVQATQALHLDMMKLMRKTYPQIMLSATIPFASDVERMVVYRAPVLVTEPNSAAGRAYRNLAEDVILRTGL